MRMSVPCSLALSFLALAAFAAADTQPDLNGTWQFNAAKSHGHAKAAVWIINQKPDSVHIKRIDDRQSVVSDLSCALGKECDTKDEGRSAKMSVWYNGPALVVLETRGSDVVKRRVKLGGDGSLAVEVMPIVPEGETETLVFDKAPK